MLVPCAPIARDAAAFVQARVLAQRAVVPAASAERHDHHAHGDHAHGHREAMAAAHGHARPERNAGAHAHRATHTAASTPHDAHPAHAAHAAHADAPSGDGRASVVAPCPCGCDDAPPGTSTGSRLPVAALPAVLAAAPIAEPARGIPLLPALPAPAHRGSDPIPI